MSLKIFSNLKKFLNNIALINDDGKQYTYSKILNYADKISIKIKGRSTILFICKNSIESIVGYLSFIKRGCVLILVDNKIKKNNLSNILSKFRPKYIFHPNQNKFNFKKIFLFKNYSLSKTNLKIDYKINNKLTLLISTSGTTGNSEFVRQSYKNLESNINSIVKYLNIKSNDRAITTMPMNYVYGLSIVNSHLSQGSSIMLTEKKIVDRGFWEFFKKFKATTFGGVPFIFEVLKKLKFKKMNLPSLRYITQAGGKMDEDLLSEFIEICKKRKKKFIVMYGQTEATARMSYLSWKNSKTKIGSIGKPIPEGKFFLEDKNGKIITKSNIVGELIYKGKNVCLGYAKNRFDLIKGDENKGTLKTGDLAKKDSKSFYYIIGRKKRFVKIFGHRINLEHIEEILKNKGCNCPCIGDDKKINIYIEKNKINKNKVEKIILENTNLNKQYFSIILINKIPRNKSGKVLYSLLDKKNNNNL